jgi:lipoprotein-anchoring transpeptidase ErfK/SrfK
VAAPVRKVPKIITIDKDKFELRLWRIVGPRYQTELKRMVALGQIGNETPPGMYFIDVKNRKPDWRAPNSDWVAPEMRGKIVPFASEKNPFAGGFISFDSQRGLGIHGTKFDPQLGTLASHGCVRMAVDDLVDLYNKVSVGTPVFVY